MGLVARVVEQSGIPTITVSTARDLSLQVKPPRTVFINHPMGNSFGRSGDAQMQRQILTDALQMLVSCTRPGELIDLDYQWDEPIAYRPKKKDAQYQQTK
ncbi:MAG: D-proline reductase (dithiol) PrdB [Gammaproteobacteria bacterium]